MKRKEERMKTLTKIQAELKTPKAQVNAFGKYKYRSVEDVTSSLKPILAKNNATIYFDDKWDIESGWLHTTLHYIHEETHLEIHASTKMDTHKGMSSEQCCGSAMSYCHKYALNNLLLIDDSKDVDSMDNANDSGNATGKNDAIEQIKVANSIEELKRIYYSLPEELKHDDEVNQWLTAKKEDLSINK